MLKAEDELAALERALAYSAARSDIECYCAAADADFGGGRSVMRNKYPQGVEPVQSAGGQVMDRAACGRDARLGSARDCIPLPRPTPATAAVPEKTRAGGASPVNANPARSWVSLEASTC